MKTLQFGFRRKIEPQLQTEATECGLACLCMIAVFHGYDTDLPTIRRRFAPSLKGLTLADIIKISTALEFSTRAVSLDLHELNMLSLPCILHWDLRHFVVLESVHREHVVLVDPAVGACKVSFSDLSRHFSGVALELTPSPRFTPKQDKQRISLRALMGKTTGIVRGLVKIFLLAFALEVLSIVAPFYTQWVVDEAIMTSDKHLLYTLAFAFAILVLIQAATEALRSWAVIVSSTVLNVQWLANVFRHLLTLPIDYFSKRHIGDIVSRFDSVNIIQQALTVGFVESIFDGIMSVGTISIMLIYDKWLSLVSIIAVISYAVLRYILYSALRMANQQQIVFAARGKSLLMESVRGIQSLRLFGKSDERLSRWLNLVITEKNCGSFEN